MKKTGPSHAVGYKPSKKQDRYSLESNQCVCADGKGVRETSKSRSKSSLTGPTSLEMLKNPIIRKWPKNFALGNRTNDFLGLGKHFLSPHIPTVLEKRTFSTPTVLTALNGRAVTCSQLTYF